jgi:hypothetical protein
MPTRHIVQAGEGLESIAEQYGLFLETVWNDDANAELREKRKSPFVLSAGDVVVVPDKRAKTVRLQTGKSHQFKRKGVPVQFRLLLLDADQQPRATVRYHLWIDEQLHEGVTDDDGWLCEWISPNAAAGRLELPAYHVEYDLHFGQLDPIDREAGVRTRLRNLGYLGEDDDEAESLAAALTGFQRDHGLDASGSADDATRQKLVAEHKS